MANRKWTVMIYQAGDNNLSEECVYALKELKKIGTFVGDERKLEVIVQLDPGGRGNPTRRFRIGQAGGDGTLECDELDEHRRLETDTGSPDTLLNFLCESIDEYPADYYMVILSGHGGGVTEGSFLKDETLPLSLIPSALSIPNIAKIFGHPRLKESLCGDKIDILGFDSCLMSMAELCYELRNAGTLDLLIASEGFSLNAGWPYQRIINELKRRYLRPAQLADFILNQHIRFYFDYHLGGLSVDLAILRMSEVVRFKEAVDRLAHVLLGELETADRQKEDGKWPNFLDQIVLAHWEAQSYCGEQCVDLYDFCDRLEKRYPHGHVPAACKWVREAIEQRLVQRSCYSGAQFQFSHGVSIYFPWSELDIAPHYRGLAFGHVPHNPAQESPWLDFLLKYTEVTQREARVPADDKLREESQHRYTPPWNRGPEGVIHSMRNPPTEFYLSDCFRPE